METKRKGDPKTRARFGSDRMFQHSNKWFFYTREGTVEGPYAEKFEASRQVKIYIGMAASQLAGELTLEPRGLR